MHGLAGIFVGLKKIRIQIHGALDLFPREKFVLARRHAGDGESSARVSRSLPIKARLIPSRSIGNQNDGGSSESLLIFRNRSGDPPGTRAQRELSSGRVVVDNFYAGFHYVRFSAGLQIIPIRQGKDFNLVGSFGNVVKREDAIGSQGGGTDVGGKAQR